MPLPGFRWPRQRASHKDEPEADRHRCFSLLCQTTDMPWVDEGVTGKGCPAAARAYLVVAALLALAAFRDLVVASEGVSPWDLTKHSYDSERESGVPGDEDEGEG